MSKYIRKIVFCVLILIAICIIEFGIIFIKLNYFQISNNSENIDNYSENYTLENIIYKYIIQLQNCKTDYKDFAKVFNAKSYISECDIVKILNTYNLDKYEYELTIVEIIKLSKNQYKCKYELSYESVALADGYDGSDIANFENEEKIKYINEVIIDINYDKNGFKVLYNKFDLGGGAFYEK